MTIGASHHSLHPSGDLNNLVICARVAAISEPFNAEQQVEVKLELPLCGNNGVLGGEVYLRVAPQDAARYVIGDRYTLHARRMV